MESPAHINMPEVLVVLASEHGLLQQTDMDTSRHLVESVSIYHGQSEPNSSCFDKRGMNNQFKMSVYCGVPVQADHLQRGRYP